MEHYKLTSSTDAKLSDRPPNHVRIAAHGRVKNYVTYILAQLVNRNITSNRSFVEKARYDRCRFIRHWLVHLKSRFRFRDSQKTTREEGRR